MKASLLAIVIGLMFSTSTFAKGLTFTQQVEGYACNGLFGKVRLKRQLQESQQEFFNLKCKRNGMKLQSFKLHVAGEGQNGCRVIRKSSCNESRWDSNTRDTIICKGVAQAVCG